MHCVHLADLAALISDHSPTIASRSATLEPDTVANYWASSRARLNLWYHAIAKYRQAQQRADWASLRHWWRDYTAVLEEVLVSELLTRVVAAFGAEYDRRQGSDEIEPITHAVFLSHVEARNRVQQVMIDGRGCSVPDAVRLNRLRQGVERWIDSLLGRMQLGEDLLRRYAIRADQAMALTRETRDYGQGMHRRTASLLMNAALHDMLVRRTSPQAALPAANAQVGNSVLLMLHAGLFDDVGYLKSLWLTRIEQANDRTDGTLTPDDLPCEVAGEFPAELNQPRDPQMERWYW